MGILKKPYEISIWTDTLNGNEFLEEKVAIIGSNIMTDQYRALEPKLKRNVNGSNELTFKMYRRYKDNITGEEVENPFIDLIKNETKIKLKYKNKWYDFLIKNISQDSNNHTHTFTATDLHIIELSKNGYGLVLDSSLMNNSGTAKELADKILADTDWTVEAEESLDQFIEEPLVKMLGSADISPNIDSIVLVPYSSLKDKPYFFQYFKLNAVPDDDGIYRGKNQQSAVVMTGDNAYITDEEASKYGFYYPSGWSFEGITNLRGERLVYSHKSEYNPVLGKVVYYYKGNIEAQTDEDDWNIEDIENAQSATVTESSSTQTRMEKTVKNYAGYTETEYVTPNLIQNLITNSSFKSTNGWTGAYICGNGEGHDNKGGEYNTRVSIDTYPDMMRDIMDGNFDAEQTYQPYIRMYFPDTKSIVTNTGFYDNRKIIKNLQPLSKFVLFYKQKIPGGSFADELNSFRISLNAAKYDVATGHYLPVQVQNSWLRFSSTAGINYTDDSENEYYGYKYKIAYVDANYSHTEQEFQKIKTYLTFYCLDKTGSRAAGELEFYDIQIFPYVQDPNNLSRPLVPSNQAVEATTHTTYTYYDVDENPKMASLDNNALAAKDYKLIQSDQPNTGLEPVYVTKKVRSINVKQSNYFNAIQTLCESFGCWADFVIEHYDDGRIKDKTVVLREHNNSENYAGFKYGVNLKNTKRTLDSKQIVTKLIVPDNVNAQAPNGFCSIARAASNETGENYIYNFQYYINQQLVNENELKAELFDYYKELLEYNNAIKILNEQKLSLSRTFDQVNADLQIAENGKNESAELFQENVNSFFDSAGFGYTEINNSQKKAQVESSTTLTKYLTAIMEYYAANQKYSKELEELETTYNNYKARLEEYDVNIKDWQDKKNNINKVFFQKFYRYIQEGTWKGNDYIDNEKYYIDALSTSTESSLPKVTYTFNILDLSILPGYEEFEFELADKTWVEDPEFFGYNNDGTPYKEQVIITEITYSLDEPDRNTIKIQNFKDSFADLFQKQTAAVQSVQFAKDAWSKAGSQATASAAQQMQQIQNALTNSQMVYMNPGDQSVIQDNEGITVTDVGVPSRQLRLVGGAVLARDPEGDGTSWRVLLSPEGINAKMITAGQIDTRVLQIMNKDEPYFRWDQFGLTAYYFDENTNLYRHGLDTTRGVRFDRFGIYGYNGEDGLIWHPNSVDDIEEKALFALTWDGLFLNLGTATYNKYVTYYKDENDEWIGVEKSFETPKNHSSNSKIGKTTNYLYNSWFNNTESTELYGLPYYDESKKDDPTFTKIMAIGDSNNNENLAIYDDGTLVARRVKLVGDIEWTTMSSPSKSVYGKAQLVTPPPNNTFYPNIPENDSKDADGTEEKPYVWHKNVNTGDSVYCHTDNGGATWEGPFLIYGLSIEETEIQYAIDDLGADPEKIEKDGWSTEFPNEVTNGKCVFTRSRDIYTNGDKSIWRYSIGYIGEDGEDNISVKIISSAGDIYINNDISTRLTVQVFQGTTDITSHFDSQAFLWSKFDKDGNQVTTFSERGVSIEVDSNDVFKKAVFQCEIELQEE